MSSNSIFLKILLILPFIFQSTFLFGQKSQAFEAKVDWTCAPDFIQVLVHTRHPFHGIIHPSGFHSEKPSSCAIQGNGTLTTRLQIALNGNDNAWDDCGLQMDPDTSTLWTLLEVHEHALVMLSQDRTVNISCTGWSQSQKGSRSADDDDDDQQQREFRLAIISSADDSDGRPVNVVFLGTEYNLAVQTAAQPVALGGSIFVHSCSAMSSDKQTKLQLIDSDGCSMDHRLITDFVQPNRMVISSSSTPPLIFPSSQKLLSQNRSTIHQKQQQARNTVATAKIAQMFRFNTQSDHLRLSSSGSVIHFECTVEKCEGDGRMPTALAPCPKMNCDRKRTIANQQQPETTEHGGDVPAEELELVTQLLRAQQEEEAPEFDEDVDGSGAQTPAEVPDEAEEDRENEAEPERQKNGSTVSGEVKQQKLQLVQRRQKQLQVVRNVVHVFESRRNGKYGTILDVPTDAIDVETTMSSSSSSSSITVSNAPQQPAATLPAASDRTPYRTTDSTEFVISSTNPTMSMPPNFTSSSSSTLQNCVSMEQLTRLYMLGMALCALFLLGCICNLFMCCLSRRRTATGAVGLPSPFRTKRGRRQQQKGGQSSHTTLTSSLYGSAGNVVKNGNSKSAQHQVGFWISEDGQQRNGGTTNGGGTIEYAPMVSSFYEGVPNVTDASSILPPQRRLSVHSYASVKHRGNSQLLCKMPMPTPMHQHLNQQLSMSPSSYSPSTTTSSSTSGGPAGSVHHDNINNNTNQLLQHNQQNHGGQPQQQHPPLPTHSMVHTRSTFHPEQQPSLSIASSVRSSTTLDGVGGGGGGPSCSQSTVDDDDAAENVGGRTPRPGVEFSTVQQHQQYNNNNGMKMSTSTFGRPTTTSTPATKTMIMNNNHLNESFSIL
uniref:ZP domain-containing protein n=1 Tax=Globodera rostochiensis TaxID=31243 RepID=A0A914H923_GLORO